MNLKNVYCSIYCVGGWGLDPYYNSMVGVAREEETEKAGH